MTRFQHVCVRVLSALCSISIVATCEAKNNWFSQKWQQWTNPSSNGESVLGGDTPYTVSDAAKEHAYVQCAQSTHGRSFDTWKRACDTLPRFNAHTKNEYKTVLDLALFEHELDQCITLMHTQYKKVHWLHGVHPSYTCGTFQAYAQKLIVPSDAVVAVHGDVHGDIHALNRFITYCAHKGYLDTQDSFKIVDPNFYMLFLGDYVDRGWYGAEVIYAIMRLRAYPETDKLKNL